MIKAILFDVRNTLFFDDIKPKPIEEFAKKLDKNIEDYKFLKAFEKIFETKKQKDLKIPIRGILKELKIKYDEKLLKELYVILKKIGSNPKPYPETFEVLRKLKKVYKIVLITNDFYYSYNHLKLRYNLNKYSDITLVSYQTKLLKPDPRIFKLALEKLNLRKEDVIMVGDNMQDDVIAAQKFGINAILIDRKNKHPNFKNRITSLNEIFNFLR